MDGLPVPAAPEAPPAAAFQVAVISCLKGSYELVALRTIHPAAPPPAP